MGMFLSHQQKPLRLSKDADSDKATTLQAATVQLRETDLLEIKFTLILSRFTTYFSSNSACSLDKKGKKAD